MATTQEWFDDDKPDACPEMPLTRRERFSRWLHRHIPAFIITNLLLILLLISLWSRIIVVIPAGHCGVLFSTFSGTVTDHIYREGLHIISPFNTMTTYDMRWQIITHEYRFLTMNGLEVNLKLVIRYAPEFDELPLLHQEVGPEYPTRVLEPEIAYILHNRVGNYKVDDIVMNKDNLLGKALTSAMQNLDDRHIRIDNITISSMSVPDTIKAAIEEKVAQQQVLESYQFRQQIAEKESKRVQTEAVGIRERNKILAKSLDDRLLRREQIEATRDLAKSPNAKIVIMGSGGDGKLPLIVTQ
jgi:regulator of protease activity HflC (stomatin/prohibitin superfamily)